MADFVISSDQFEPAYLALHRRGLLDQRVQQALDLLSPCRVCPRNCPVDRLADQQGACRVGRYAQVASYFAHHGEEDCLRGDRGSGTIFFSGCNLGCVFCQNADISQSIKGQPVGPARLAEMMLELQAAGCHNINWVTPEHVVPQILEALPIAIEGGLRLPIVYNTSAFDSHEGLSLLDGIVDIYMPDFKMWESKATRRYLRAREYPGVARQAIKEMHRQVGDLVLDENGLALRGLLVRHLVMPDSIAGTSHIAQFLADEISPGTYLNLMDQYYPAGKVSKKRFSEINRRLTSAEFRQARQEVMAAGLWRLDERVPRMRHIL